MSKGRDVRGLGMLAISVLHQSRSIHDYFFCHPERIGAGKMQMKLPEPYQSQSLSEQKVDASECLQTKAVFSFSAGLMQRLSGELAMRGSTFDPRGPKVHRNQTRTSVRIQAVVTSDLGERHT